MLSTTAARRTQQLVQAVRDKGVLLQAELHSFYWVRHPSRCFLSVAFSPLLFAAVPFFFSQGCGYSGSEDSGNLWSPGHELKAQPPPELDPQELEGANVDAKTIRRLVAHAIALNAIQEYTVTVLSAPHSCLVP